MGDHKGCALAIVGSRGVSLYQSESIIKQAILEHQPSIVISGGADGVDRAAVKLAEDLGYATLEYLPTMNTWDAPDDAHQTEEIVTERGMKVRVPGGFKQRNAKIAASCDCLVRISSVTTKTYGSGWTADYAEQLGKRVTRFNV